jgi:tRNA threonylcarbamoyl adenosine modification protein (Sua5/YciO/YrdC/YwlC family)
MVDSRRSRAKTVRVVTIEPMNPRSDRVAEAVAILARGGAVALPTETFYGLAVDAFHRAALIRLHALKRKPVHSPILLLLGDLGQVEAVAARLPERFAELAASFWPGPLTLVIPASHDVPEEVTGGTGTVAVRVPGLALPRHVARDLGRPITGPSANRHGEPPCRTAGAVAQVFGDELDAILDGGTTSAGAPSTILDLCGARPRILREGILPAASLAPFLEAPRG